jgi:hypothetical protein
MDMRALVVPACALLACVASQAAQAQGSNREATRYFTFDSGLLDDLDVDGVLTETRQGNRVTSAKLDVCYPQPDNSSRQDRFVVTLNSDRGHWTGSTKSQETGGPVSVDIVQRQNGSNYTFEGNIKLGSDNYKVSSDDNSDMNEKEYHESLSDNKIIATPADFTEVSPDTVGIRVKRKSLGDLVKALKGQDASIDFTSLETSCDVLRTGDHVVLIQINPDRAAALIDKVKGLPGVSAAGYSAGTYSIDTAVRIAMADFRKGDNKIDDDKLGKAIAAAAEKALSAKLRSSNWDKTTGEFALELTRPDDTVAGYDLTEVVRLRTLVAPEKSGRNDNLIIWVGDVAAETVDNGAEPRLKLTGAAAASDDNDESSQSDDVVGQLADDLKGKTWDSKGLAWK